MKGYLDILNSKARKYYEQLGEKVLSVRIQIGVNPSSIVVECEGGVIYVHTVEELEQL